MVNCYGVYEKDITEKEILTTLSFYAIRIGVKTIRQFMEAKNERNKETQTLLQSVDKG